MVELFVLDDDGDYELKSEIDSYGEETYSRIDERENIETEIYDEESKGILKEPKKIPKFKKFSSIYRIFQIFEGQLSVCKMTGYPEILISTITFINEKENSVFLKGISDGIKLKDDLIVFKKKASNFLFAQPTPYSFISHEIYICFKIENSFISEDMKQILGNPYSSFIVNDITSKNIKEDGPWRILLNSDVIESDHSDALEKFKFQKFTEVKSGKDYFISMEIENIHEILSKEKFFLEKILTLLQVSKTILKIPYNFDEPFSGWGFTVFPFILFVYGLSAIPVTSITGRIVHLSQSSGHGKTRLCFELLKYIRSGAYCVYRSNPDNGFPDTTPWFENLFLIFKKSKSDIDSLIYCALFVLSCVVKFCKLDETELEKFKGKHSENSNEKDFDFILDAKETKQEFLDKILTKIRTKIADNIFPIIFDECHEMLVTPVNQPDSLNLYRVMRRLFFKLKDTRIVAIFLGTKSSMSDFMLNYRRDPSIRDLAGDEEDFIDVPCYIYTQNVDSMFTGLHLITHSSCLSTRNIGGTHVSDPTCLIDVSREFGRPLWARYLYINAIKLALEKLKTDGNLFELTSLILRTGSQIVPQDELAHKLVLSGMATLLNVDIDGSRCWVEYIPEPILSNAARIALTNITTLDKAIKEYLRRLEIGSFHDSGYSGELVARIVLLRVMDLSILRQQVSIEDLSKTDDIKVYSSKNLFGNSNLNLEVGKKVLGKSISSPTGAGANNSETKYLSPYIGVTTVRKYLMLLGSLCDDSSLWQLGVSDEVLDGSIYLNQFVHTENPLIINQKYLLHFFARSCGMILARGAKGADLIIPVLRTDNLMSCIVLQVKNYGIETFPNKSTETNAKLTSKYLDFLNLGKIADFEEVFADDFVRVVIQFSMREEENDNIKWVEIPDSVSKSNIKSAETELIRRTSLRVNPKQVFKCKAMWLNGMSCFESLFFGNESIINNLNIILNGQRDFLNGIQYPKKKLPTLIQTSLEGARFLANNARTLVNFDNIVIRDAQLRDKCDRKSVYEEYLKDLETFTIPPFSLNHVENCTLTTNLCEKSKTSKSLVKSDSFENFPVEVQEDLKKVLMTVEYQNRHLLEPINTSINHRDEGHNTDDVDDDVDADVDDNDHDTEHKMVPASKRQKHQTRNIN